MDGMNCRNNTQGQSSLTQTHRQTHCNQREKVMKTNLKCENNWMDTNAKHVEELCAKKLTERDMS